jgi:hypothetical protein
MNKVNDALFFALIAWLGLGCGGSALKSGGLGGSAAGGQSGQNSSGGALGSGGAIFVGGAGGGAQGLGGSVSGGTTAAGGIQSFGGRSGSNTGGSAGGISGAGGATCAPFACTAMACLYGELPNPDPCSCPICASPDAGTLKDAATDACSPIPCAYPLCSPGYEVMTPPCGCPTCVPVDAGQPDAIVCPPIGCPAVTCTSGTVPDRDPCGCPICVGADAGADTSKLACVALDECTCGKTSGCVSIAEACYCPYPQCGKSGACFCGGGLFIGCAPTNLATCTAAKDRVATLCPQLKGATFGSLCQASDSSCITKCLNDVTSCSDVFCSFCDECNCAGGAFMACRTKCTAALTRSTVDGGIQAHRR